MNRVYCNQNGIFMYVGTVRKKYDVGDIIKLKRVFYPMKVIVIDNFNDVYCEFIKQ